MKKTTLFVLLALMGFLFSCNSEQKPNSEKEPTEESNKHEASVSEDEHAVTDDKEEEENTEEVEEENKSLDGSYKNADGQELSISNYQEGEGFDFSVKWGSNDEWGCMMSSKGKAKMNGANSAYFGLSANDADISFSIDGEQIKIEASPMFIGMDCAKYGDSQSPEKTTFKRQ